MTRVGSIIDGKYRVIEKIGEGGMSVVWLVTDARLGKQWAMKEIKKNARTETHKVIADSLKAEANLMRGLDHPALPRIVDIIDDGASLYIVMDFIQGDNLLTILKDRRRVITEENVISWGIQLCDALSYLHSRGIVYRDMKPSNIMLLSDGTVKIIDFGIAREYSPDKEDDTMPLGTRGYASPEAFKRGVQTTPISDIYSLGVTLFHLVTGHGPMEFVDQPNLPPIRTINPDLSEGLERVIIQATQWAPSQRYQSCVEMRYDLEHLDDLTTGHRRRLQRTMTLFKVFSGAGLAFLVLGVAILVAGRLMGSSSHVLDIASLALAVVFILLAVAVFFVRDVPSAHAEISGKKRAEEMARISSATASIAYRSSTIASAQPSGQVSFAPVQWEQTEVSSALSNSAQQALPTDVQRRAQEARMRVSPAMHAHVEERRPADTAVNRQEDSIMQRRGGHIKASDAHARGDRSGAFEFDLVRKIVLEDSQEHVLVQ